MTGEAILYKLLQLDQREREHALNEAFLLARASVPQDRPISIIRESRMKFLDDPMEVWLHAKFTTAIERFLASENPTTLGKVVSSEPIEGFYLSLDLLTVYFHECFTARIVDVARGSVSYGWDILTLGLGWLGSSPETVTVDQMELGSCTAEQLWAISHYVSINTLMGDSDCIESWNAFWKHLNVECR
jgi:hypothetical protein